MKKRRKVASWIWYFVSASTVVFGTLFLVTLAQGNTFDWLNGRLKPTGLLMLNSQPSGANITFNGKLQKNKTPLRITYIEPGPIHVEMKKDGYRNWAAQSKITAGQVTFLTYAWLIPDVVQTINHLSTIAPVQMTQSFNEKHTLLVSQTPQPTLFLTDNFNGVDIIYQPLPAIDTSQSVASLNIVKISDDGSSAVILQTLQNKTQQYIFVNVQSHEVVNLTDLYHVNTPLVEFNPSNSHELFWLDAQSLHKINVDNKSNTVILDKILYSTVSATNLKIYYIQLTNGIRSLYSSDLSGQKPIKILTDIDDSPTYEISATNYQGHTYIALLVTRTHRLTLYNDIPGDNSKNGNVLENVTAFSFNKTGRFLDIVQDNKLLNYDIEKSEYNTVSTNLTGIKNWQWLDEYHLIVADDKGLRMMDFDGQNDQTVFSGMVLGISTVNKEPVVLAAGSSQNTLQELVLIKR